jgi:hypothetical protein
MKPESTQRSLQGPAHSVPDPKSSRRRPPNPRRWPAGGPVVEGLDQPLTVGASMNSAITARSSSSLWKWRRYRYCSLSAHMERSMPSLHSVRPHRRAKSLFPRHLTSWATPTDWRGARFGKDSRQYDGRSFSMRAATRDTGVSSGRCSHLARISLSGTLCAAL